MTDDLIEGEIIEGTDLVVHTPQDAPTGVAPLNLFGSSPKESIEQMSEIANLLTDIIKKKALYKQISGKTHVTVEGWTLLGSLLGVFASVVSTERVTEPAAGYKARAEARTLDGRLVGAGEAICTRAESMWKSRDEFALMAMAQTRATSRALRNPLGFVVKMAGYETAGAEEMPPPDPPPGAASSRMSGTDSTIPTNASVAPEALRSDVIALLVTKGGKTTDEARTIVNSYKTDENWLRRAKQQLEAKPDRVAS